MRLIPLTQGKSAIVDDDLFDFLNQWKWCYNKHNNNGYAVRSVQISKGKYKCIYMHRLIMNPPENMEVDHISGDTLDNRRENLSICTHRENLQNMKKPSKNKSGYQNVYWNKPSNTWQVRLEKDKKRYSFGYYHSKEEAIAVARVGRQRLFNS